MKILNGNFQGTLERKSYLALGSFDGLHLGHISLVNKVKELSKANNTNSIVYTFSNHPLTVVNKEKAPKLIMDNETKIKLLDSIGIDIAVFVEFTESFMKLEPEAFIKMILKQFNIKGIVVGFNYRFGYKNSGNVELLEKLKEKYNFELHILNPMKDDEELISSSRIRQLIAEGKVNEANKFLLQPFMLKGEVVKGRGIGAKTLGYPTANLNFCNEFIIPEIGIYYTNVKLRGENYRGITSVGHNPTVNGKNLTIETFILDFDDDIYGEIIELYFIEKTREEIKFPSVNELIEQLKKDESLAKGKKIFIK